MKGNIVIEAPVSANANIVVELENTIKENISTIQKLKSEKKKLSEMFKDTFLNDATYREHDTAVKEATKIRTKTKAELLKNPTVADLKEKIKDLSDQIKDTEGALSDYAGEFNRMTGSTEIESDDGTRWNIIKKYKIIAAQQKLFH